MKINHRNGKITSITGYNSPVVFYNKWYAYKNERDEYVVCNLNSKYIHLDMAVDHENKKVIVHEKIKYIPMSIIKKTINMIKQEEQFDDYAVEWLELYRGGRNI